jgi:predicted Zn finger-like uncharacterized protein
MALATQCPHCHTTFRVAHDQLKLRAGIVRCGACNQIFNGVEQLLPPDAIQPAGMLHRPDAAASDGKIDPSQPPVPVMPSYASQHDGDMMFKPFNAIVTDTSANSAPEIPAEPPEQISSPGAIDPDLAQSEYEALEQMTQKHFIEAEQPWEDIPLKPGEPELPSTRMEMVAAEPEQLPESAPTEEEIAVPDSTQADIEDTQQNLSIEMDAVSASTSPTGVPGETENGFTNDEPDFVKRGRQQQRYKRPRQLLFGIAALLLFIGAMAQTTYAFRNQIAARLPQTKPALISACAMIGCNVTWPEQIDLLTIDASELQALPNNSNAFSLTLLLRNHGSISEAWPSIQLTLNDENERAVARRIFTPRDYLGSAAEIEKGFPSNTEQSAKIFFTLAQLKASGYRVYLFYP